MEGNIIIPISVLFAIIGWLTIDKIRSQSKKDEEQDSKLEKLNTAITGIYELLAKHQRDIEWLIKANK